MLIRVQQRTGHADRERKRGRNCAREVRAASVKDVGQRSHESQETARSMPACLLRRLPLRHALIQPHTMATGPP